MDLETSRAKVEACLVREGWINVGGAKHDKFKRAGHRQSIILPRHRRLRRASQGASLKLQVGFSPAFQTPETEEKPNAIHGFD